MVGQQKLADEDIGNGESKRADQIIESAGFPDQTGESVLVQGKDGLTVDDPQFKAAIVDDAVETLGADASGVSDVEDPLSGGHERTSPRTGAPRSSHFELPGDEDAGQGPTSTPRSTAVAQVQTRASRGRRSSSPATPR